MIRFIKNTLALVAELENINVKLRSIGIDESIIKRIKDKSKKEAETSYASYPDILKRNLNTLYIDGMWALKNDISYKAFLIRGKNNIKD